MRRVLINSAVLVGVNLTSAGFGFLLSVVVARALGVEDFGRYTLGMAWSFALGLFAEYGLGTLLTRDLARRREQASSYLTAATIIKTALSLILVGGLEAAAPQLSQDPAAVTAIRLAAPLIWLNSLFGSFTAIFRAFERMTPILVLNAASSLVQLMLTIGVLLGGGGVVDVIVLAVAVQVAELATAYLIYRLRFWTTEENGVDWGLVIKLGRAALPFALAGVLGAIQLRASVLLLGALQPQSAVGYLGAATRWVEAAKIVPNAFFGALFPALSFLAAERFFKLDSTFRFSERGLLVFGSAAAVALTVAAPTLLTVTYGPAFAPAVPALQILGWVLVPALWNGAIVLYLYALGDEAFTNYVSILGLTVQLASSVLLISMWGAAGAALAALLGESVMVVPFRLRLMQRRRKMLSWQIAT